MKLAFQLYCSLMQYQLLTCWRYYFLLMRKNKMRLHSRAGWSHAESEGYEDKISAYWRDFKCRFSLTEEKNRLQKGSACLFQTLFSLLFCFHLTWILIRHRARPDTLQASLSEILQLVDNTSNKKSLVVAPVFSENIILCCSMISYTNSLKAHSVQLIVVGEDKKRSS